MKHLTLLNPHAGGYSTREQAQISRALKGLEGKVSATPDLAAVERELQSVDEIPDLLGIGGGDGTVSQTLTKAKECWGTFPAYLAVYALGTMNNIAVPVGVSGGLIDKIKRSLRIGKTRPVQLAHYLARSDLESLSTTALTPMKVNGRYGFNVGFGLVPKLVWRYYGKSIEDYGRVIERLSRVHRGGKNTAAELSFTSRSGIADVTKIVFETLAAMYNPDASVYQYFNRPIEADIYINGRKQSFASPPTGIYIASYESQNVGLFRGMPSPGARAVPGKMELVITSASMRDIIFSLPAIMRGKPIRHTRYVHARELHVESKEIMMCQVDGELRVDHYFTIVPAMPLRFISLR